MKLIGIMIIMCLSINLFAQKEIQSLAKGSAVSWKIEKVLENGNETIRYFSYTYQNAKYSYITDIGGIFISDKETLEKFISALIQFSSYEKGKTISLEVGNCKLQVYDFSNYIFIADNEDKYFTITKRKALVFANEIKEYVNLLQ